MIKNNVSIKVIAPTVVEFNSLRESVGWNNIDVELVRKGLANSLYSLCAVVENNVVGCVRLVGDGFLKIYIEELLVNPQFQHQGIGTLLMNDIMDYIHQNYKKGCSIGLFSNTDLEDFYKRFGFIKRKENMPGMQLRL